MNKLEFAKALVYDTGAYIKRHLHDDLSIDTKSARNDFVTNMDKHVEFLLTDGIKRQYPMQDFITEEKVVQTQGLNDVWIIDPIDGTSNFIFERQNFAISVAYYENEKPVFGIVYDVMANEMFVGITGQGAFLNDHPLKTLQPIANPSEAVVYTDVITLEKFYGDCVGGHNQFLSVRYKGAASLEICGIAAGRYHAYLSRRLKIWDIAAAVIILNEVGGYFTYNGIENRCIFKDENYEFVGAATQELLNSIHQLR